MGKSSLIYVIGLSLIIGYVLVNINSITMRSMDTYTRYYGTTMGHNIAVAGANIGSRTVLNTLPAHQPPANFGFDFADGHDTVLFCLDSSVAGQQPKVVVRSVSQLPLKGYDGLSIRDTVEGIFRRTQFAKYAWFTEREWNGYLDTSGGYSPFWHQDDWKITGDSIWGEAHTNYRFNLDGRPYFADKVTALLAAQEVHRMIDGVMQGPDYQQGYEWGVDVKRPTSANLQADFDSYAAAGGWHYDGGGVRDVSLTFQNDDVHVRIPASGTAITDTVMSIADFAPNGVAVIDNADVHVRGVYKGRLTVAAFGGTSGAAANKGNVWIDGSLTAYDSPRSNPNSSDMLGLVAGRMGYVSKNQSPPLGPGSVLNVDAAIYCQNGEFTAERFWDPGDRGRLSLFGGATQVSAGSLGIFNPKTGTMSAGMAYSVHADPRFQRVQPPFFPASDSYSLASWWEK